MYEGPLSNYDYSGTCQYIPDIYKLWSRITKTTENPSKIKWCNSSFNLNVRYYYQYC